jgi:hypothetical protein
MGSVWRRFFNTGNGFDGDDHSGNGFRRALVTRRQSLSHLFTASPESQGYVGILALLWLPLISRLGLQ